MLLNKCKGTVIMNIAIERIIGRNLRRLREEAGLTQELLAAKLQINGCDITRSAVAKIEVGQRHIYADELVLFQKILGVSYDEMLNLDANK